MSRSLARNAQLIMITVFFSFGFFGILKTTNAKKAFLMFCKWLELDESVFAELISRQNHFSVLAHSAGPLFARRLKQGAVA